MTSHAARATRISLALALLLSLGGCASPSSNPDRRACLQFEASSQVNDGSSIVLNLIGVTNPEQFRAAKPFELFSANPPGTEGNRERVVVTPGDSGSVEVRIERLSKRLGIIADYRNRTNDTKVATDVRISCWWPKPKIKLLRNSLDE